MQAYGRDADDLIVRALCDGPIDDGAVPQRRNGEAAFTILEHEQMHQETLLYMFHELPYEQEESRSRRCGEAAQRRRATS